MAPAPLSAGFQSFPPLPTIKLGPSGGDSQVGELVHALGPCGSLQWPLLWGWVFPAAASTPSGVFNQWFEALFSHTGTLGCMVCHRVHQLLPCQPAAALPTPLHNPPPHWVCQPSPCHESSLLYCPSPPLLPVWNNVSSLSPWSLDFHTVWFSVSSGCFLFLNCCCPSFGFARRHSVSTYASILARSVRIHIIPF